jgi:ribosomal protein S3AE
MATKQGTKVVTKEWYEVEAPKQFKNIIVGEIIADSPTKLIGRTVVIALSEITRNIRLQGVNVKFRIYDVLNKRAKTNFVGYEITPPAVKRFVSRRKNKIDDSFVVLTKDNIAIRIKPLVITAFMTKGVVEKRLRAKIRELLFKAIKEMNYEDFSQVLISHKLQDGLRAELSKVYPIRTFEIRMFEITKSKPTKIEIREDFQEKRKSKKEEIEEEQTAEQEVEQQETKTGKSEQENKEQEIKGANQEKKKKREEKSE